MELSKKGLYLLIGSVVVGFAFLAAVNAGGGTFGTACSGFDEIKNWFSNDPWCEDVLPARIAVLGIGIGIFFTLAYFADKAEKEGVAAGKRPSTAKPSYASKVVAVQPPPVVPVPVAPAPVATQAPVANAEFKTCPDCAEQVRAAARKCRFCNYEFFAPGSASIG